MPTPAPTGPRLEGANGASGPRGACHGHPDRLGAPCPRCGTFACPECARPTGTPGETACAACAGPPPDAHRDLGAEGFALLAALAPDLLMVAGLGFLAVSVALLGLVVSGAPSHVGPSRILRAYPYVLSMLLPALALIALGWYGGKSLRAWKASGRWITTLASLYLALWIPVGTVFAAVGLWAIHRPRGRALFRPDYRRAVAATPQLEPWSHRTSALYITLVLVLAGAQLALFAGPLVAVIQVAMGSR